MTYNQTNNLISTLLLSLCANYPLTNITVTTVQPWKWVPEKRKSDNEPHCILKSNEQIRQEILKDKRLRIATLPNQPPISWVTADGNDSLKGHGIAFEMVNTLSEKFGFNYDVLVPTKNTLINKEGSIINMLIEGEVDMVAAFIPVLPGMEDLLQWGIELSHYDYVVMMKRPKESATGSGLLAPFEIEVWFLILISLIIVGPIIYAMMVLRSKLCGHTKIYPITSCIWFVYGALMKQGSSLSPDNDSTRIMFATWWLFIMILTSFYTANLTAFLTLSKFTLPIQSIEDIAKPAHRWIAVEGGSIDYAVKVDNGLASLKHSYNRGRGKFVDTADTLQIKSLIADGVLFLHDRDWLNFFMLQIERSITNEKEHCKFVLTTKSYLSRSLSFVFPKHSHLPNLFNPVMLSYVESGIIKHLLTKELPEATICPLNLGSKEQKLHNSDLLTTYAVVITGFSVASVVFISELLSRFWSRWRGSTNVQPTNLQNTKRYSDKFLSNKTKGKLTSNLPENIVYVNGRNYTFGTQPNQLKLIPERQLSSFLFQHVK